MHPTQPRRRRSVVRNSSQPLVEDLSPEEAQARLLDRMTHAAKLCHEVEALLRKEPGPELETIIQLHRVLVLKLSAEAQGAPELLKLVNILMKPLMDWARLEESRKERELAEKKYADELETQKTAEERGPGQALRPVTLEKIEHELHLF